MKPSETKVLNSSFLASEGSLCASSATLGLGKKQQMTCTCEELRERLAIKSKKIAIRTNEVEGEVLGYELAILKIEAKLSDDPVKQAAQMAKIAELQGRIARCTTKMEKIHLDASMLDLQVDAYAMKLENCALDRIPSHIRNLLGGLGLPGFTSGSITDTPRNGGMFDRLFAGAPMFEFAVDSLGDHLSSFLRGPTRGWGFDVEEEPNSEPAAESTDAPGTADGSADDDSSATATPADASASTS